MRRSKAQAESYNQFSILTVDDDPIMTSTLQAYFQRSGYRVETENDPKQAIERVRTGQFDILLLDFLMTPICGDKVVEEIRRFNKDIYIILLTGHKSMAPPIKTIRELDIQGYYEKDDRFDQLELLVESCTKSIRQMRTIKQYQTQLGEAYQTLKDSYLEIIQALRLLVDARNMYTRGHSDRVSRLAEDLAASMGRTPEYCERVRVAGLFHDIGKIGVPDDILLKNDRLTDEEYEAIKGHSATGARVLSAIRAFQDIAPAVRSHHERYDGTGYPDHLKGDRIPEVGRIIAVADSFDAMTSDRQYRRGLTAPEAFEEMRKGSGAQFDPCIVDAFFKLVEACGQEEFWKKYVAAKAETGKIAEEDV